MNEQKKEPKAMWQDTQQLIRANLEKMVRRNRLAKIEAIADEIGMSENEFRNKVSITPRTPMTTAERISIEHVIALRDPQTFQEYLQSFHLYNNIEVFQ